MIKIIPLTDEEIKKLIFKIIKDKNNEIKIILFGSRAKGNNRQNSDYDIALVDENKIPRKLLFEIREELENLPTLKIFDLVDFNDLNKEFQNIILKEGVVLNE